MTVITTRINKKNIEVAWDSQMTIGRYAKEDVFFGKVQEVNGMVIGSAGSVEEMSLMRLFARNHKPVEATEDAVLEFFSEFNDWMRAKKAANGIQLSNHYILVYQGKAFFIDRFLVTEIKEFYAIGSGRDYALAAMHLGHGVEEACEAAAKFDLYCHTPIHTITINNEQLQKKKTTKKR